MFLKHDIMETSGGESIGSLVLVTWYFDVKVSPCAFAQPAWEINGEDHCMPARYL